MVHRPSRVFTRCKGSANLKAVQSFKGFYSPLAASFFGFDKGKTFRKTDGKLAGVVKNK